MRFLTALLVFGPPLFGAGYTTYIGDRFPYGVAALATDSTGNTYVTGSRNPLGQLSDVFVTRVDPSGNIVFTTTFGGKGVDRANAIALDPAGNIYVGGTTSSANFPLRNALQTDPSSMGTGFIVKLSPDGGTVLYSTYFGGTRALNAVNALAADAKGDLYVAGYTYAPDFPTTPGLPAGRVGFNMVPITGGAFFAKIASAGNQILYSGLIVGNSVSCGGGSSCFLSGRNTTAVGISVDASGNAYVAGNTNTTDLPATPGALLTQGIGAFVAKVNAAGDSLGYFTYLGATNYVLVPFSNPANTLTAITVDASGNAYLAGSTTDPKFPATAGSYQPQFGGTAPAGPYPPPPSDAFVAKLKPDGSGMVWATYLGGQEADAARSLALDASGNVWVAGATQSDSFPNANGWSQGGDFLAEINAAGSALPFSARFPSGAVAQAVAVDTTGLVHAAGFAGLISTITPAQALAARVFGITNAAGGPLAGRIAPGELISIYGPSLGPSAPLAAAPDSSGFYPKSLGGVQVTIGGIAAPLLYVSGTQINAVVPFGVTSETATVQVLTGVPVPAFRAAVDSTAPAIFANPDGSAAAVNQDRTINSPQNPAKAGSVVSIWATGTVTASLTDGQVATAAQNYCFSCSISADTTSVNVLYAGSAPGLVAGVVQINFQLPANLSGSEVSIALTSGGRSSGSVTIHTAP
jgi:uncharacterized protein (TIGR03437 family)